MAGELETLSTDEPLAARVARHGFDRLIMLSDGVFAIAITLLALELELPEGWDGRLVSLLKDAGRPLVGYVFAFFLVGAFWLGHRRLFARLVRTDRVISLLNLLALGLIGLAPYVARLIAETGPTRAVPTYLMLTGAIFGTLAAIHAYAEYRGLLHPELAPGQRRAASVGMGIAAVVILGGGLYSGTIGDTPSPMVLATVAIGAVVLSRTARHLVSRS